MAECGHCGSSAGPRSTERMARSTLERAIQSAASAGVRRVAFTGGEPLAHRELALDAVRWANAAGLHSTVCTNAYWAEDEAATERVIGELVAAGLDRMQLSTDKWHTDYIPASRVVRAAEHAALTTLEVQVAIPSGRGDWAALSLADRFGHIAGIQVFTHPAHAVGRGEFLPAGVLQSAKPQLEGCHLAGHHEIDVDGRVSICPTSADFGPSSVLRAGDATDDDLGELLARSHAKPLPLAIASWGPYGIAKLAGWSSERLESFAHDCHLCRALHQDDTAVRAIAERHGADLSKPVDQAERNQIMHQLELALGETVVAIQC